MSVPRRAMASRYRIGQGVDVHRRAAGRRLVLGGVEIPGAWGLLGHSDADVVLHAIGNALLGAIGEGDLGRHFPDDDPEYRDIASSRLLREVLELVSARGYRVVNTDVTIVAETPPLADHLPAMRSRIARLIGRDSSAVNVKAARPEGLGSLGAGEGIAALAVVLLEESRSREG